MSLPPLAARSARHSKTATKPPSTKPASAPAFRAVLESSVDAGLKWAQPLAASFKKIGPEVGARLQDDALKVARQFAKLATPAATTAMQFSRPSSGVANLFTDGSVRVTVHDRVGGYRDVHLEDARHPGFQLWAYADKKGRVDQRTVSFQGENLRVRWVTTPQEEKVLTESVTPYGLAAQMRQGGQVVEQSIERFLGTGLSLALKGPTDKMVKAQSEALVLTPPVTATAGEALAQTQTVANQLGRAVTVLHNGHSTTLSPAGAKPTQARAWSP